MVKVLCRVQTLVFNSCSLLSMHAWVWIRFPAYTGYSSVQKRKFSPVILICLFWGFTWGMYSGLSHHLESYWWLLLLCFWWSWTVPQSQKGAQQSVYSSWRGMLTHLCWSILQYDWIWMGNQCTNWFSEILQWFPKYLWCFNLTDDQWKLSSIQWSLVEMSGYHHWG